MLEELKCLQNEGLRANKEKCCFLTTSVQYLGHRIDANGIHATGKKLEYIMILAYPLSWLEMLLHMALGL